MTAPAPDGRARGWWATGAGLAGGLLLDGLVGDPRRGHPVAAFGRVAGAAERLLYADARLPGAAYAAVLVGGATGLGVVAGRTPDRTAYRVLLTALATWSMVGGTTLRREAAVMSTLLQGSDLPAARRRLSHLCGRDAGGLEAGEIARAVVESVAENTSDAHVGPLVWGALFGVPGLLGYRAVNTLDAMVGHRSERYLRFGWASARADDVANLLPARVSAVLATLCAPLVGGRATDATRAWRRDGGKHPSPNAGPVEAAFAGALGRRLGGAVVYAGRIEHRPSLGSGAPPERADIARAARLSAAVSASAGVLAVAVRLALDGHRR
ncbi:MAG: cobalamin biosynthesis protein [Actinobacteria bacterium]|nr:cobalamin biosynthesis protein [Actinomycetota bacterium]